MFGKKTVLTAAIFLTITNTYADTQSHPIDAKINKLLAEHFDKYTSEEYFSGISLSVYTPESNIQNFYIGHVSHNEGSAKIDKSTLFQIGSITKSFTAALMLKLQSDGKLDLDSSLKDWLPEYSKWSGVKLTQLLNMTSGLPNYSDTPLWNQKIYKEPSHIWHNKELIGYVYPSGPLSPPLRGGYFYTNTGYVLANMIIDKAVDENFKQELEQRIIKPAGLADTFYPIPQATPDIQQRMAQGYNYNQYDNPAMIGKDVSDNSLSWAAAAGGMVATSADVVKWVKTLFMDNTILNNKQKEQLTTLISTETGEPIKHASETDSDGFGLGVVQKYDKDLSGNFWFYEGETLGFRAIYMYTPCNSVIITSIFNSATNSENDHAKELIVNTYQALVEDNPKLSCKPVSNGNAS